MIKRILVALSGTPFTATAVRYALELAQRHGAQLTGVTVVDVEGLSNVGPVPVGAHAAAHELAEYRHAITQQRIDESIEHFEQACHEASITGCVDRESGDPFERLISLWRYHDLTILGLRGLFEYGVVHNPSDHLIRLIRVGVRPLLAVSEQYRPIRRVLIAYKGSMASAKAMKRWIQMAPWPDAAIRIVCFDGKDEEAAELLASAAAYCEVHGKHVEVEHVSGSARRHLLEYATQTESDLIVMGSKARSRMARYVLGDTALRTIREAEIPLFLSR